ncbi:acetyltransferase (GNAT) family protein [Falsibacillus pallidus]|uniref:Acetyltransferase (GNAT) family protein n=2 Tax=Falsibacillus pallidus TaxID=493781 RepID=A0A370GT12_9BACI|nr:GNAT family N-acetyltransferase [Falsibacillus pallidus]RDI45664.1 acetyltransferase (GNAT) family protein [Falsibacillus pallidus]
MLTITRQTTPQDKSRVNQMLYFFNVKHFPDDLKDRYEEVSLSLKDDEGNVCGGLLGEICWNWLEIHVLMVNEDFRKTGYGSKLLKEAEAIAEQKKCDFIKVDTLSFQALDFYKKHGYVVYGTLDGVGREFQHYYLKKELEYKEDEVNQ